MVIDFLIKHEKKIVGAILAVVFVMGILILTQPSNIAAMQNAKVDAKKTVTTSSDKMSGNAKKIGNIGSVDGDLNL